MILHKLQRNYTIITRHLCLELAGTYVQDLYRPIENM